MFEMSRVMEIWVIVGLSVLAIMFTMSVLARLYRKAGPHEALIIYGFGGTTRRQGTRRDRLPDGASLPRAFARTDVVRLWRRNRISTPSKASQSPSKRSRKSK